MGKKINVDKLDSERAADDTEDALESLESAEAAEEVVIEAESGTAGIDVAKIIKSTGGIQSAVSSTGPMIDQIATHARLEAQRASALAMKEYRRQLQTIVSSMQGTIREEGVRLADQICARITTQIRQAVLLETEKKALNLVDEFVLGWQIEAETMSQDLLAVSAEPTAEPRTIKSAEKIESVAKEEPASHEKTARIVETMEKDKISPPTAVTEEKTPAGTVLKKQAENVGGDQKLKAEQSETEKKVVFDFATFIAQSKSPLKS
jgi:hypothetical protein